MAETNGKKPESGMTNPTKPGNEQVFPGDVFIHERSGIKYFASAIVRTVDFGIEGTPVHTASLQIRPMSSISDAVKIEDLPKMG